VAGVCSATTPSSRQSRRWWAGTRCQWR
jgi:hypothetical protein